MRHYLETLKTILEKGIDREGRNGFTRSLFTLQMRFDMQEGFPAVTTKKLAFQAVKGELLWFLKGATKDGRADDFLLQEIMGTNQTIWTANAEAPYWKPKAHFPGDLGRIYGVQWRDWQTPNGKPVDQIQQIIERLKKDPYDRRLIVSAWNPGELDQMALPPCHVLFQLYVVQKKLSLHMFQRSCDMFLGVPFNIASYGLLLAMIAQVTQLEQGELILTLGDAHIYHAHLSQVQQQLERDPFPLSTLHLNPEIKSIDAFTMEDITLLDYQHHPSIKAQMIV